MNATQRALTGANRRLEAYTFDGGDGVAPHGAVESRLAAAHQAIEAIDALTPGSAQTSLEQRATAALRTVVDRHFGRQSAIHVSRIAVAARLEDIAELVSKAGTAPKEVKKKLVEVFRKEWQGVSDFHVAAGARRSTDLEKMREQFASYDADQVLKILKRFGGIQQEVKDELDAAQDQARRLELADGAAAQVVKTIELFVSNDVTPKTVASVLEAAKAKIAAAMDEGGIGDHDDEVDDADGDETDVDSYDDVDVDYDDEFDGDDEDDEGDDVTQYARGLGELIDAVHKAAKAAGVP